MRWFSKLGFALALAASAASAQTLGPPGSGSAAPTGTAGGDLSGTYPNPGVAKVNGNTPGGTCTNQVVTAISSSAVPTCANVPSGAIPNTAVSGALANPLAGSSGSILMMGFGTACTLTPSYSGRLFIQFTGSVANTLLGDGSLLQTKYGTGTAPTNGAASTGTQVGNTVNVTSPIAGALGAFSVGGIVTGLTKGTAYWFDMTLQPNLGGVSTITVPTCSVFEF